MRILLDTHALLWWLSDDRRLGRHARERIADPRTEVLASITSLWEIVVKIRIGKLDADIAEIVTALDQQGMAVLDVAPRHLVALAGLPRHADHRDPFDHLLVAQALMEEATFVSEDRNCRRYPIEVMTCSDRVPPTHPQ